MEHGSVRNQNDLGQRLISQSSSDADTQNPSIFRRAMGWLRRTSYKVIPRGRGVTPAAAAGLLLVLCFLVWLLFHNNKTTSTNIPTAPIVPSLEDTLNLASLSQLIYAFHASQESSAEICRRINQRNLSQIDIQMLMQHEHANSTLSYSSDDSTSYSLPSSSSSYTEPHIPGDVECHFYHHDWWGGTQVLLMESHQDNYVAVVFCGTDDIRTSLTDVNILTTPYGRSSNGTSVLNVTNTNVRVHAGFDHAVFDHGLFPDIERRVRVLLQAHPERRLFTTGHSLGAADAILTATGLQQSWSDKPIVSINFGCPRTGNMAWREFMHGDHMENVTIWRFVLGRDLVPRLPTLFQHVGHTVQLETSVTTNVTPAVAAYYHHWGNETLGLAGVPTGWSATPYIWVPGALMSHRMWRYRQFLSETTDWMEDFERKVTPTPRQDDDFYDEPPDDEGDFRDYEIQ